MPDLSVHIPGFGTISEQQARLIVELGQKAEWLVFGLGGNSQVLGGGGTLALPQQLPGEPEAPHPRVYALSQSNQVVLAQTPIGEFEGSINIDPTIALGKRLAAYTGRNTKILLVQCAKGGTSFSAGNWVDGGAEFEDAVTRMNLAGALPGAVKAGFFLGLGDIEAADPVTAAAFGAQLADFVDDFRAAMEDDGQGQVPDLPIVVSTCRNGAHKATVNAAIRALPRARVKCAVVEGEDLLSGQEEEGNGDTVHFGPEARREYGRRLADGWLRARTVGPTDRPFTDGDLAQLVQVLLDQATTSGTLLAHIGSGAGSHAVATGSAAGFLSAADKSKLDGIEAGSQVNDLETLTNLGSGGQVARDVVAKAGRFRSLSGPNMQIVQSDNELALLPFPALPTFDCRFYATAANGLTTDVAVQNGLASASIGTNVGIVGVSGDGRGPVMGSGANAGFLVNGYQLSESSYTICAWISPLSFPTALDRRTICGSIATSASNGWEFAVEKVNKVDGSANIVDQFWEVSANHRQDGTKVRGWGRLKNLNWTHVAAVYAMSGSEGRLMVFLNGRLEHIRTFPNATDRGILVGGFNGGVSWFGGLDELTFWSVALSPRQIMRHMIQTAEKFTNFGGIL